MARKRVLVVDDSVVVRKLVGDVLAEDPAVEVAGTAPNGRVALAKLDQLAPDLVTLDVEMPEMDGIEALRRLRRSHPRLPVVMFSTLTERGARVTMDALMLGANEYVTKPSNVGSVRASMDAVREQLLPKVRALCGLPVEAAPAASSPPRPSPRRSSVRRSAGPAAPVSAVVIGVSTGGPNALAELVPALPADLGVPVLCVQHMPPLFTGLLADRLDAHGAMTVREAVHGRPVDEAGMWLAPGDHHLTVEPGPGGPRLATTQGPPENSCRPAADVLFRSAAAVWQAGVLAVVLTGMGQDGLRGCEAVVDGGGHVLAQDRASSVVWGMPGVVSDAGLADAVLPLRQMAAAIVDRVRSAPLTREAAR